ncbi:MAG: hypothetical protein K6E51_14620 [Treponema sp.]|nr:hypothetical protein [Treponema sp.]
MSERNLHGYDLYVSCLEEEIWKLSAEKRPRTAADLEKRLSHYLNTEKKPSLEALEMEAGASEPNEFLRWCDGEDCTPEWRDVCRDAYKKVRSSVLSRRFEKLQRAKRKYIQAICDFDEEWIRA